MVRLVRTKINCIEKALKRASLQINITQKRVWMHYCGVNGLMNGDRGKI